MSADCLISNQIIDQVATAQCNSELTDSSSNDAATITEPEAACTQITDTVNISTGNVSADCTVSNDVSLHDATAQFDSKHAAGSSNDEHLCYEPENPASLIVETASNSTQHVTADCLISNQIIDQVATAQCNSELTDSSSNDAATITEPEAACTQITDTVNISTGNVSADCTVSNDVSLHDATAQFDSKHAAGK